MKRFLILLILFLWGTCSYSQDIIIKENGEELKANVLEITLENNIKYELYDSSDSSVKIIEPDKVFMIIYENGEREKFIDKGVNNDKKEKKSTGEDEKESTSKEEAKETITPSEPNAKPAEPITKDRKRPTKSNEKSGYFAIGTGYGYSYGGAGIKMQILSSGNTRVGFHGGVGYFPRLGGWVLYSAGLQVYFLDNTYLDAQFGSFGVKKFAYSEYTSSFDGQSSFESGSESNRLYGPSLQVGYDWYLGDHFGFNLASGVSYNINQPEFADAINYNGFGWAADFGMVIRF